MELSPVLYALIFAAGLVFGSFFNVAIYRWPKEDPKEREWVFTPSHCPKCGARIRWFDNIPLASWLILRGKCRDCHAPISLRYPLVELGTALLWVGTTWLVAHHGWSGQGAAAMTGWHVFFALYFASLYFLTVIIDFQTSIIPDEISLAHFVGAWAALWLCQPATLSPGWAQSLIGMAALAALFFVFYWFGGMGYGDVKLAAGMGVLFGWQLVLVAGFVGILLGGTVAFALMVWLIARGKYRRFIPIPFGPYLAIASYITLFLGVELKDWYLSLFNL